MPGPILSSLVRGAVFAPLENGDRVEAVVQRLTDSIALGVLRGGEQLPAQRDLAAVLGVSLVTLRQSLARMEQQGLVETRRGHGGGSFIRYDAEVSSARAGDRLLRMSTYDLVDLADMQRSVYGEAAKLAAERCAPGTVYRLLNDLDRLAQSTQSPDRSRGDGRFRIEVAAASQSVRLTRTQMQLQAEVGDLRWLTARTPGEHLASDAEYHKDIVHSHRELVHAIGAGDGERARTMTEDRVNRDLRRLLGLHRQILSG